MVPSLCAAALRGSAKLWQRPRVEVIVAYILGGYESRTFLCVFVVQNKIQSPGPCPPLEASAQHCLGTDYMAKCRLFQCTKFLSTALYYHSKSTAILILVLTASLYNISAILRGFYLNTS